MNEKRQRGFTMVEIVVTMIIVGTMAAYAIPRMMGPGEFAVRTNADRLLAALQYAQTLAQRQGVESKVVITTTTVSVKQGATNVKLATENNAIGDYVFDIHPEVTISPSCGQSTVTFGTDGLPTLGVRCIYNINEDGVKRFTVTVERTGFSHLGT